MDSNNKLIDGVIYQVLEVTSNFSSGKFTQDIRATIATIFDSDTKTNTEQGRENQSAAETNRLNRAGTTTQATTTQTTPDQGVAIIPQNVPNTTISSGDKDG